MFASSIYSVLYRWYNVINRVTNGVIVRLVFYSVVFGFHSVIVEYKHILDFFIEYNGNVAYT